MYRLSRLCGAARDRCYLGGAAISTDCPSRKVFALTVITFSSPVNAFGFEVGDWATCCTGNTRSIDVQNAYGAPATGSGESLTRGLLSWVLACTFVYSALFGTGSWLYGRMPQFWLCLTLCIGSGFATWRSLQGNRA